MPNIKLKTWRIIYCNLNCSVPAHDMLERNAEEVGADIICCSEPNRGVVSQNESWAVDLGRNAAICSAKGEGCGAGNGFVWMEFSGFVVYTCYISPNVGMDAFEQFLDGLSSSMSQQKKGVVIVGDFNAWATIWGSRLTDKRGKTFLE